MLLPEQQALLDAGICYECHERIGATGRCATCVAFWRAQYSGALASLALLPSRPRRFIDMEP